MYLPSPTLPSPPFPHPPFPHLPFPHHPSLSDVSRLKPIKELLPLTVEYWEIKMVIAIMMVTTGFVRPSMTATNPSANSVGDTQISQGASSVGDTQTSQGASSVGGAQSSQGAGRAPLGLTQQEPQGATANKRKLPASLSQSQNAPAKPKPKQSRFW